MNIKLHPEVLKLLGDAPDLEKTINDIVLIYLTGGFIRTRDVVEKFVLDKIYRKRADNLAPVFDQITQQFQGMAVVGKTDSETLWIASPKLHDVLEEHMEILVMKSPRNKTSISLRTGKDIEVASVPVKEFN